MNRLWAAGAISLILAAICTTAVLATQNITDSMTEQIEQIANAVLEEDQQTAINLHKQVTEKWQVHHAVLCTFMSHMHLEEIDRSLAALSAYLESGEKADMQAECNRIIEMIRHLEETELPYIQNIL